MNSSDQVARLREIKRLLDRIQQLPHIAGMPGNGLPAGFHIGPPALVDDDPEPEPELSIAPPLVRPHKPQFDAIVPPIELPYRGDRELPDLSRALVSAPPSGRAGMNPWLFVVATVVNAIIAAALAVVITLGTARRDPPPAEPEKVAASIRPMVEPYGDPALLRPAELLPVGSPAEPLRMEALKPARLPLQLRPEEALEESYILLLSGLPANATLSGASRMGADSWLLSSGALRHIELILPEWSASVIEVGVELRRTNGAVVAQSKLWLAVPPPPVASGPSLDEAAIKELVRNGDRLLGRGDVVAARALYERAAAMGNAQAALALGSTYDPRRLWSLGVFGMVGNKERARHWYQRAAELGHPEARERLGALNASAR